MHTRHKQNDASVSCFTHSRVQNAQWTVKNYFYSYKYRWHVEKGPSGLVQLTFIATSSRSAGPPRNWVGQLQSLSRSRTGAAGLWVKAAKSSCLLCFSTILKSQQLKLSSFFSVCPCSTLKIRMVSSKVKRGLQEKPELLTGFFSCTRTLTRTPFQEYYFFKYFN